MRGELLGVLEERERMGQEERLGPFGWSSWPWVMDETVVLNIRLDGLGSCCCPALVGLALSSSMILDKRPLLRFAFSVMVATVRRGLLYFSASELQSKRILDPLAPSHTCISLYGWTRDCATCCQAPMPSRNAIEEGVRLLARFEYSPAFGFQSNRLERGCDSTSAILRCLVIGDDSRGGQDRTRCVDVCRCVYTARKTYSMLPPMQALLDLPQP